MKKIVVAGGGVFGSTAALELRRRGCEVTLLDAATIPAPLAASTDISKLVRMEYGADQLYMELAELAIDGWSEWNRRLASEGDEPCYHATGLAMLCMDPMAAGGFEYESFHTLRERGHHPERVDKNWLTRFPAWNTDCFVDGFFHARGGFAESSRAIAALAAWLREEGVRIIENAPVSRILVEAGRVTGVETRAGDRVAADHVVVATGAWTGKLLGLAETIRATGHPVFHLRPSNPDLYRAERFPSFTADVARTGYYGFPLSRDGVVKIGVHAVGVEVDPDDERIVRKEQEERLRQFLARAVPSLAQAPIVYTRLCLYADTPDEHFWIDNHPEVRGLTVSTGGSGHGFKFAPVLGALAADAVMGIDNHFLPRFAWRSSDEVSEGREAARCHTVQE